MKTDERRIEAQLAQRNDVQNAARPVDRDEISRRAYERYEERGREGGHDVDDWLEAERDLQRQSNER
jgi:outer membrane protein TolC